MLSRIAARTATVAAGFLAAACLVALPSPEPASAAGPQSVCSQYTYINGTIQPEGDASAIFALNGHYIINGKFNQNGNIAYSKWLVSWLFQTTNNNYIAVEVRNASSSTQDAVGFMLEDYLC
jgi:hypothetical protein